MSIKRLDDGRYEVDIRPRGREGRRIRRKFERKAEALAFERYTLANANTKEWAGQRADRRTLLELLDVWWKYYGQNHARGTKEFNHLLKTIGDMGDIPVTRLNKRILMDYRSVRLREGVSASTINRDLYRLSGMFSKLIQLEEFAGAHPIHGLPPLAEANPEMAFLDKAEISHLLNSFTGDDLLVALLGISTGGRWSELVTLKPAQIVNGRVTFLKTKNGKLRTVPISSELESLIKKNASGNLFNVDYVSFCKVLKMVKPDIPANQATHILRHTFASHFMMNGGNIVALQQILGHANIQQTMTYAHLSPEYLQNAVALNPLAGGISL